MMPLCDHQNWLQRRLGRQCWRVARHLTVIDMHQYAACDKHEAWYRKKVAALGVK